MKYNLTVILTLILLVMMFGAGLVSASWGLAIGREALKGITQPDVRPTNNLGNGQKRSHPKDAQPFLTEEEILKRVKARIEGKDEKSDKKENSAGDSKQSSKGNPEAQLAGFPVRSQDGGVTMEVKSANTSADTLQLKVGIKNDSKRSVRFLYSFLNVTDEKGRVLSASTSGLPGELPPNGETFSGTVTIPTVLLEKAEKISLTLTDYPDQKLQLKMSAIPVVR